MKLTSYDCSAPLPSYQIRAAYDESTIRVYQAYSDEIADAAIRHGTFVTPPFSLTRMTWIKPSFLWMMYRSGWSLKDAKQARILAIDITRDGFDRALRNACLSSCPPHVDKEAWRQRKDTMPNVVQWDPEKNILLDPLPHRSVQIGIGATAVKAYVNDWIRRIEDVTAFARDLHWLVQEERIEEAVAFLPVERPYPAALDEITPVRPS